MSNKISLFPNTQLKCTAVDYIWQILYKINTMSKYDISAFNELIKNRRSVLPPLYQAGKTIPDDIIIQLLRNANWAPNHKHTEPWRFTIISGEGRNWFARLQSELYRKNAGEHWKEIKLKKLETFPLMASHIIAIGMKRHAGVINEVEEIAATACAVQNLFLSVTAYGLAGYWSTGGITYYEEARPYFGLASEDKLMGFFYLGYPTIDLGEGYKRGDIVDKVTHIDSDHFIPNLNPA